MKVITDIAFEHDTMSGKTRITVTKQEVAASPDYLSRHDHNFPLVQIGEPDVEEITIWP